MIMTSDYLTVMIYQAAVMKIANVLSVDNLK